MRNSTTTSEHSKLWQYSTDGLNHVSYFMWPAAAELAEQQRQFYVGDGFLDVVIAIYGTYARIQKSLSHEEVSANRHFYHSINVQLMLHARSGILNVVSKWPGSVYDSYVLSQSSVEETFAADTAASSSATSATCAGRG